MIQYGHTEQEYVTVLSTMSAWETITWWPAFVCSRWKQEKKETFWWRIAAAIRFTGLWMELVIINHRRNH